MRDDLIRRLAERVAPENPERARLALDRSPELAGDLTWLADMFDAADHLPLEDVPPHVSAGLHRMFRGTQPAASHPEDAVAIHDSRHGEELVGVRGEGDDAWTMMFTAPSADVVVDGRPTTDATHLTGQVLLRTGGTEAFEVTAVGSGSVTHHTDELGQFDLGALDAGSWTITVAGDNTQLTFRVEL